VPERPTVSIVMPTLNQARFLPRALHSLLTQEGDFELECIVIDGGSTDGSLGILEGYGDAIRWVSEPDNGAGDAANKGFAMAGGSIFGWLFSDDLLAPGALKRAVDVFTREPQVQWLYGKAKIIDEHDRIIRRPITAYKNLRMRRFSYRSLLTENWISAMAVFWRRPAHELVGPIREDTPANDYEFWLRLGKRWPGRFVNEYLAAFRWYPTSTSGSGFETAFREDLRMAEEHADGAYPREILLHRLTSARTILVYKAMRTVARWRGCV
jgi:glycosyltransferase involved in cell wall biosynthesis